jgi:hypothetical protein
MCFSPSYDSMWSSIAHPRINSTSYACSNTANTTSKSPLVSTGSSRKCISRCLLHLQILCSFFYILANPVTHTRAYSHSNSGSDTGTNARSDSACKFSFTSLWFKENLLSRMSRKFSRLVSNRSWNGPSQEIKRLTFLSEPEHHSNNKNKLTSKT